MKTLLGIFTSFSLTVLVGSAIAEVDTPIGRQNRTGRSAAQQAPTAAPGAVEATRNPLLPDTSSSQTFPANSPKNAPNPMLSGTPSPLPGNSFSPVPNAPTPNPVNPGVSNPMAPNPSSIRPQPVNPRPAPAPRSANDDTPAQVASMNRSEIIPIRKDQS